MKSTKVEDGVHHVVIAELGESTASDALGDA
jgi:hypothetical protein